MAYSETRIVIGGLAHVPILIFIANFIKGKFGIKTGLEKDTFVKEEPVKIKEVKGKVVKEGKAKAIKEISNKERNLDLENVSTLMVIFMREITWIIKEMAMENLP